MPATFPSHAAAAVATIYPLTWPALPYQHASYVQGVRMIWSVALALLAAAAAARLATRVRRRAPVAGGVAAGWGS